MDREKAETYQIILDMFAKMFLVLVISAVFVVVTGFLLWRPNWYFAAADAVFGYTIGKVVLHYFPPGGPTNKKKNAIPSKE